MQPSKHNPRLDMNITNSPAQCKQPQLPRNLNNTIISLQELAEQLAKTTAVLDNSTQCVRLLEPRVTKDTLPTVNPPSSMIAATLNGIYESLDATHRRLKDIQSELDFDFPPGP